MGTLIPFNHKENKSGCSPLDKQSAQILSERHKDVLNYRLAVLTKSLTPSKLKTVYQETLNKLKDIHSSKEFVTEMTKRVILLHRILFDEGFPKTKSTEKNITAGLLYFLSPEDFLPDDIPGLGYLDDAYVIDRVFELECHQIVKYLQANGLNEKLYM